jgi:hypothetical protein
MYALGFGLPVGIAFAMKGIGKLLTNFRSQLHCNSDIVSLWLFSFNLHFLHYSVLFQHLPSALDFLRIRSGKQNFLCV